MINFKTVKQKIKQHKNKKPPIFKILNRLNLFLFSFSCVIFIFYIAGNWQGFLDDSQKLLLLVTNISSILLLLFIIVGFMLIVVFSFKQKTMYFLRFIPLYILYGAICLSIMLFSSAITFISR